VWRLMRTQSDFCMHFASSARISLHELGMYGFQTQFADCSWSKRGCEDQLEFREISVCNFSAKTMSSVKAQYTSPTHSLNVEHVVNPSDDSQKASLKFLHQAVLSTQADLNTFLTERKLEEDRANGVNGTATSKRKAKDEEEEEGDENGEDVEEEE
jgi:hypothetical protein